MVGFLRSLRKTLQLVGEKIKFQTTLKKLTHLMMLILTMMSTQNLKWRHYKRNIDIIIQKITRVLLSVGKIKMQEKFNLDIDI